MSTAEEKKDDSASILFLDNDDTPTVTRFSHELLHRPRGFLASTSASIPQTRESLALVEGENWLRLMSIDKNTGNRIFQDTQDTTFADGNVPYPSLVSISDRAYPDEECYIVFDVDGPYVTVKDMRYFRESQDDPDVLQLLVARSEAKLELEGLPRRQLRFLKPGDCLVTRAEGGNEYEVGLVLEYRRHNGPLPQSQGVRPTSLSATTQLLAPTGTQEEPTQIHSPFLESRATLENNVVPSGNSENGDLLSAGDVESYSEDEETRPMTPSNVSTLTEGVTDFIITQGATDDNCDCSSTTTMDSNDETQNTTTKSIVEEFSENAQDPEATQAFHSDIDLTTQSSVKVNGNEVLEGTLEETDSEGERSKTPSLDPMTLPSASRPEAIGATYEIDSRHATQSSVSYEVKKSHGTERQGQVLVGQDIEHTTAAHSVENNHAVSEAAGAEETNTVGATENEGRSHSRPEEQGKSCGIILSGTPVVQSELDMPCCHDSSSLSEAEAPRSAEDDLSEASFLTDPQQSQLLNPGRLMNAASQGCEKSKEVEDTPEHVRSRVSHRGVQGSTRVPIVATRDADHKNESQGNGDDSNNTTDPPATRIEVADAHVGESKTENAKIALGSLREEDPDPEFVRASENTGPQESSSVRVNGQEPRETAREPIKSPATDEPMVAPMMNTPEPSMRVVRTPSSPAGTAVATDEDTVKSKKRIGTPVSTRASARKRSRRASDESTAIRSTVHTDVVHDIRILMTGVVATVHYKKMAKALGGVLIENVEDAATATHVIASDDETPLRRTPKLMIGICQTSNIVHVDWLIQSAKSRIAMPCNEFLLLSEQDFEKKYSVCMRRALRRGDTMRRNNKTLFGGYSIFVCKGVSGHKAPPENELRLIVEGAGGKWLTSPSRITKVNAKATLIITNDPPEKKHLSERDVAKALKAGARQLTTSWLFDCIIAQEITGLSR